MDRVLKRASINKTWTSTITNLEVSFPNLPQPWSSYLLAVLILAILGYFSWGLWHRVYNLYFHPLAKFPGPQEAALSKRWLYKNSQGGQVEAVIEKLHEQYNSQAIRISPNELHISDVSLYKTIYSQSDPWTKDGDFYAAFITPHSVFAETDHSLHKERRKLLSPFFSRAGVLNVQGLMQEKVKTLDSRFRKLPPKSKVNLYNAFRCLTVDIISDYASGKCLDQVTTSDNSFSGSYLEPFDAMASIIWDLCYNPFMRKMVIWTPLFITKRLSKESRAVLMLQEANTAALTAYRFNPDVGRPVVYSALDSCTEVEAVAEATDILAAGSDTTAYSLSVALWHLMNKPALKRELVEALNTIIPNPKDMPDLPTLEKIPILAAIIKESVRIATPVPGRLPRIVPNHAALVVDGIRVPPGTIVGMSAYTMHQSKELWGPNAREFDPRRWLTGNTAAMELNMVSFSKGRRSCIGQPLAYAEMYIVLAHIFRNFDFTLALGSATPNRMDRFTASVGEPGLLAYVTPREK